MAETEKKEEQKQEQKQKQEQEQKHSLTRCGIDPESNSIQLSFCFSDRGRLWQGSIADRNCDYGFSCCRTNASTICYEDIVTNSISHKLSDARFPYH